MSRPRFETDDGTQRSDLIVHLPSHRSLVVDAKVPLQAYLESLEAPDEKTHAELLREHARQVRTHVAQLAAKKYGSQFAEAPEFAVAFLPAEPFFGAALEHAPGLIEFGARHR